ncbi:MAG: hypothetical protein ABDI20_08060, partial [Candidatus Bipolaricaulaceae bacterium]
VKIVLTTVAAYSIEKGLDILFHQQIEPLPDVIALNVIDVINTYIVYSAKAFEQDRFNSVKAFEQDRFKIYMDYYADDLKGDLFGKPKETYPATVSAMLADPEDGAVYQSILSILLHYAGEVTFVGPEEFKKRMGLVLRTIGYLAAVREQRHILLREQLPGYWRPKGSYLLNNDNDCEVVIGLTRVRTQNNITTVDVAAVRISLRDQPYLDRQLYINWFKEATDLLVKAEAEAEARREEQEKITRGVYGERVAAVVFRTQVDPASVRALADAVYSSGILFGTSTSGYLIWREESKVVFSRVNIRPPGCSVEHDVAIVRTLVPDWASLPVEEYVPKYIPKTTNPGNPSKTSNPGQSQWSSSTPVVLAGGGERVDTPIYFMWKPGL